MERVRLLKKSYQDVLAASHPPKIRKAMLEGILS
jgi:hypothetical protein